MDAERWRRIESLFDRALDLPPSERAVVLAAADPALAEEVRALLEAAPSAASMLKSVVSGEAARLGATRRIGTRTGAFELIGLLGEGGMGAVYLGERADAAFVQRVAIKIMARSLGSPDAVARFRDERQILAALDHPNIVRLLDGGSTEDGAPYLVMEHIEGVAITRYAIQHQLGLRARIALVRRVCGALQYAHQNLVVHRDIKPSNILVDARGEPKLLDFGIAKLLAPSGRFASEALTRTGFAMFTPEYASPEQVRGEAVSTATDVYSLGAVLYELVTGRSPHRTTASPLEILRVICEVDPPRASTLAPRRDRELRELDAILGKALRKEPEARYPSIEQFADDLARLLDGQPVRARPSTLGYRVRTFVRRHRVAVASTTAVIAALIAATVVSMRQAQRADEQAERAEIERANALIETQRARAAELRVQAQLDQLHAAQRARTEAEADAREKGSAAELSREQLRFALERVTREKQQARDAEQRAQAAARAERATREDAEALYRKERERVRQLEEARKKITTQLP